MLKDLNFHKTSKLRMEDIEDNIGTYFNDRHEPFVRRLVAQENQNRMGLKHPILTGIPTLGIWPAIAKQKGVDSVTRQLVRNDQAIRQAYAARQAFLRELYDRQRVLEIEKDKANQLSRAGMALGNAYVAGRILDSPTK